MRVVRLGATCDYVSEQEQDQRLVARRAPAGEVKRYREQLARGASFDVVEFLDLEDGRRVVLRDGLGWSEMINQLPADSRDGVWDGKTEETVKRDVGLVVLPDDDGPVEKHPYAHLAALAADQGVAASADELRQLSYVIILSDRLLARLCDPSRT